MKTFIRFKIRFFGACPEIKAFIRFEIRYFGAWPEIKTLVCFKICYFGVWPEIKTFVRNDRSHFHTDRSHYGDRAAVFLSARKIKQKLFRYTFHRLV